MKFDFGKMIAFEFSNLSQDFKSVLSRVTVLDCKHCNDPFYSPKQALNDISCQNR